MRILMHPAYRGQAVLAYTKAKSMELMPDAQLAVQLGLSAEDVKAARDRAPAAQLEVEEGIAYIAIQGMLFPAPSPFLDLFGVRYTDYQTLTALAQEADAREDVDRVVFDVDSGGGFVLGLVEAADVLFAMSTPTVARVKNLAASAAYWLASQADSIEMTSRADEVGSIGVAVDTAVFAEEISIASTDAPKKRPDLTTEEGRAVLREELDAFHELFVEAVTRGRGVDAATVNADFGQGGMLLAGAALAAGMVDVVPQSVVTGAGRQGAKSGAIVSAMNLAELKANHPELYAQVFADGQKAGRDAERKRVSTHLKVGRKVHTSTGNAEALTAALDGIEGDAEADVVDFFSALMGAKMVDDRQKASDALPKGAAPEPEPEPEGAVPGLADMYRRSAVRMGVDPGKLKS